MVTAKYRQPLIRPIPMFVRVCTPYLVLGSARVGVSGRELPLRVDVYNEEPALPFLQELHQHHCVLILTHHLAPLVIFLENRKFIAKN
jgi:hypothetical protein